MFERKSRVRPLLLLSFFFFSSCSFVSGHTNLANPLGYNPIDCNPPECRGPVPPAWPNGEHKARNSPERPAAYWKRGGKVKIKWHRNNHGGGFVRFSLVPVSKMNDWEWHKITAFHYGCFEAYRYRCYGFAQCGSDNDGNGYYQEIEIPNVFPDGKYVFVMVWYGGVKYDRTNAMFRTTTVPVTSGLREGRPCPVGISRGSSLCRARTPENKESQYPKVCA